MTEQQNISAVDEETRDTADTPRAPEPQPAKTGRTGLVLSVIAIAIALAAGAGLYTWGKQQASTQRATNDELVNQLTALQKEQASQKADFEKLVSQQASQLEEANRQQAAMTRQLDEVQQKVATISGSDAKAWLLAQADFLVKLAGRKLWSE